MRVIPLFLARHPTVFMTIQWRQKGGEQPLRILPYLNPDRTATPELRTLWTKAFPTRDDLPGEALVDEAGRATDAFWRVWA